MKPFVGEEDHMRFIEDAFILLTPILLIIAGIGDVWLFWNEWTTFRIEMRPLIIT